MGSTIVSGALNNIRKLVQSHERVWFVVHFWMPFNNLALQGFRFPQIPDAHIPSGVLLPLVDIQQRHMDSFLNPTNNKVSPFPINYVQPIEHSLVDLQRRFGKYGLVCLRNLECLLGDAEEVIEAFEKVQSEFTGTLQDLPDFYEMTSPVANQFDSPVKRCKTSYNKVLDELYASGSIREAIAIKLRGALSELQQAVNLAHMQALAPQDGVLHRTIAAINSPTGYKSSLDEADVWLSRQFPDFKINARLQGKSDGSSIDKLAEVLADRIGDKGTQPAKPAGLVEALAAATPEEIQALRDLFAPPPVPVAAPVSVDTDAVTPDAEEAPEEPDVPSKPEAQQCLGKTSKSGYKERCTNMAMAGTLTCAAHVTQHGKLAEELKAAQAGA